jgi:hypothetical protein
MKKVIFSTIALFTILILSLPYTGLLQQVVWRMDSAPLGPDGNNLAQALGHAKEAKLLIVNSDDTGANPTFTHGILDVMPMGSVRSNSVIVTRDNDKELHRIAEIAKQNPEWGFGVHLMLTNEYQHDFPWTPVLSKQQVPSLYNTQGLAWEKISEVEIFVNPEHVKREFIAQVQKAIDAGIPVDHIDSHMGTYYRQSRFPGAQPNGLINAAIETAQHFNIPMTINTFDRLLEKDIRHADQLGIIRPDTLFGFYELAELNRYFSYEGFAIKKMLVAWVIKNAFGFKLPYKNEAVLSEDIPIRMHIYQQALVTVAKPGLNHFYMHAASEYPGDGFVIPHGKNHQPGVDKIVRMGDSAVWASETMKQFLKDNDFILVNYREIKQVQQQWQYSTRAKTVP